MKLAKGSRDLTCFITQHGRFRMKRGPQGLASTGDEFLVRMDQMFSELPWLSRLIDDLLIQGSSKQQVLRRLRKVLKVCRKYNITIKGSKVQLGARVRFGGFIVEHTEEDGVTIKPDPKKVEAIKDFMRPSNPEELRSFLGLAGTMQM